MNSKSILTIAIAILLFVLILNTCGCGPSQAEKDLTEHMQQSTERLRKENDCLGLELAMKKAGKTDHQIAEYERDHNITVGCIK